MRKWLREYLLNFCFDADFWNRGVLFLLLSCGSFWLRHEFHPDRDTDSYLCYANVPDLHEL